MRGAGVGVGESEGKNSHSKDSCWREFEFEFEFDVRCWVRRCVGCCGLLWVAVSCIEQLVKTVFGLGPAACSLKQPEAA